MVNRVLQKLCREIDDLEVERVDVVHHPRRALRAGVRMIPTLKIGDRLLSGLLPGEGEIREFIAREMGGEK